MVLEYDADAAVDPQEGLTDVLGVRPQLVRELDHRDIPDDVERRREMLLELLGDIGHIAVVGRPLLLDLHLRIHDLVVHVRIAEHRDQQEAVLRTYPGPQIQHALFEERRAYLLPIALGHTDASDHATTSPSRS